MAGDPPPHPNPAHAASPGTGESATLLLRVWAPEAVAPTPDAQPWTAMLRQAVVSSGGAFSGSDAKTGSLPSAGFPSPACAVRAGRRLQALATGYAIESKGKLFGIAVLIYPNAANDAAALTRYFQQKACPAQIFFAAMRGAAPPEARRVEDAPFGELAVYELPYAHREEAAHSAETLLREHSHRPPVSQPPAAAPSTARSLEMSTLLGRLTARPRSVAAVLAASIAILAGVGIARRPARPSVPPVAPKIQPATESGPAIVPAPRPVVNTQAAPPPGKSERLRKQTPLEPVEAVDKPKRGRGDLTYEQIRQILTRGQNALDRGCYTEAIGYYRRVLDDDPRNGSAVSGQERARVRMRLSGENALCAR